MNGTDLLPVTDWTVAAPGQAPGLVLAGLLLAALLLTLELRRNRHHSSRRRAVRCTATVACVVALLALGLRPARWRQIDSRAGVLYTSGSTRHAPTAESVQLQAALEFSLANSSRSPAPGPSRAQAIPDTAFLTRHFTDLHRLRVVGHGLEPWQLAALVARLEVAPPPPPSPGLERISWRRSLTLGDPLLIQGRWTASEERGLLELVGPGGVEATQEIEAMSTPLSVPFSFTSKPRVEGRNLYRLRWRKASTLSTEPVTVKPSPPEPLLDVTVIQPQPVRILWLESAPRFETRHFKNWLATTGGQLALRTAISRDRYRRERQGDGPQAPTTLTSERLREFDLVVLDRNSLAELSKVEVASLRREIGDQGLGLLLLPYGDRRPSARRLRQLSLDIGIAPIEDLEELAVRLTWPTRASYAPSSPTEVVAPLRIPARALVIQGAVEPLALDSASRALVARKPLGVGYSGITLVNETFRWILEGAAPTHHHYWSQLLGSLARPSSGERWQLPSSPSLLDRPLEVVLWSRADKPTAELLTPSGQRLLLALAPDEAWNGPGPRPWRGLLWPRQAGWHGLASTPTGATTNFHAQPGEAWTRWIESQRRQVTARRAYRDAALPAPQALPSRQSQPFPLPRWPAYLLLLVSLSTLWIDEKLNRITAS